MHLGSWDGRYFYLTMWRLLLPRDQKKKKNTHTQEIHIYIGFYMYTSSQVLSTNEDSGSRRQHKLTGLVWDEMERILDVNKPWSMLKWWLLAPAWRLDQSITNSENWHLERERDVYNTSSFNLTGHLRCTWVCMFALFYLVQF